jgi:hypothetical protein
MSRVAGLIVFAALLLAVLAWMLYPRFADLLDDNVLPVLWQVEADAQCDLHSGPCRVDMPDGGLVELALSPRPVRPLVPFTIEVRYQGRELTAMSVDFNGVDMNMGFNRPILQQVAPGTYRGEGLLPTCVLDRMTWRAQVLLDGRDGRAIAAFDFDTTRR